MTSGKNLEKLVSVSDFAGGVVGSRKTTSTLNSSRHQLHLQYKRAWWQKNKERLRERARQQNKRSYQKHIEKRRAAGRARTRKLWAENPERMRTLVRESSRRWRTAHPEAYRQYKREHARLDTLKQYGLCEQDYQELLVAQNGVCAICLSQDKHSRLAVDHCHKTNKVRGLLCRGCNFALGKFADDPEVVARALVYLRNK